MTDKHSDQDAPRKRGPAKPDGHVEDLLDQALAATFPASDPVSITAKPQPPRPAKAKR